MRDAGCAALPTRAGGRRIFDLAVAAAPSSYGAGAPAMRFERSRGEAALTPFDEKMGPDGVQDHRRRKNAKSMDGEPTGPFPASP